MYDPQNGLTFRSVSTGLLVGSIMCCSNMYFGLQSGWVTMGSIQSALLGYGFFKLLQRYGLGKGFTVAENTIIQTTSVAVATMPVTAGFVGVIPALSMLTKEDNPPDGALDLSFWKLILWTLAVAFFGAFAALPLRKQTIIKEKLKFPSGAATAKVIELLHQTENNPVYFRLEDDSGHQRKNSSSGLDDMEHGVEEIPDDGRCLSFEMDISQSRRTPPRLTSDSASNGANGRCAEAYVVPGNWSQALPLLAITFLCSFVYKLIAEFVEKDGDQVLASFPIFTWIGLKTVSDWGWILYPAPGYLGQGMIMGSRTCLSMFAGALLGFAILGPIAQSQSWATGEIDNLESGAAGWVLWVSLAIMVGDSLTSLFFLIFRTTYHSLTTKTKLESSPDDSPNEVPQSWWIVGLILSAILCTAIVSPIFSMELYEPFIAVILAALIAIVAVRALGETDLNPASGVGKISQIIFSVVAPGNVVANIIAGAIVEAGAIQAGDLMQDFKTAHLLGVPPKPQFYAQILGSVVSVFLSAGVYAMYKMSWEIPGEELKVPSANIWMDMARLFNGGRLPDNVWLFALIFGILAILLVVFDQQAKFAGREVAGFLPSGIGFAVGMYVGPKYTIPRLIGSFIERIWCKTNPSTHRDLMIVVASGLVLGEGTGAIVIATIKMFSAIF